MSEAINVVGRVVATQVQYIGKTDEYRDALYGTGLWRKGQTKAVVAEVAAKMLVHVDQYVRFSDVDVLEEPAAVGKIAARQDHEDSDSQRVRDTIGQLDREGLREFITTNYRVQVDGRLGISALREQAVRLVDQFGISG